MDRGAEGHRRVHGAINDRFISVFEEAQRQPDPQHPDRKLPAPKLYGHEFPQFGGEIHFKDKLHTKEQIFDAVKAFLAEGKAAALKPSKTGHGDGIVYCHVGDSDEQSWRWSGTSAGGAASANPWRSCTAARWKWTG